MRPELKNAIDKEIKRERSRRLGKWLIPVFGAVIILAIYTPVFSEKMVGEAVGFKINETGNVSKIQMRVKLDSSAEEMVILVDRELAQHIGRKVEVSKMTSVAGMASYDFVQYLDPAQ